MTGASPRRLRLFAIAAAGTVLLAACAPSSGNPSTSSKPGGRVTVASWQEQDSLLACNITAAATHACAYVNPAMEGLLTVKANQDVPSNPKLSDYWVPELATEVPTLENGDVKVSSDKMDVTWKLRHGVKWHDGWSFTSKDVKSTFEFWWLKYRDKNPTPLTSVIGWDQVHGVDTPDDFTAIVHFKSVYAAYLTLGTGPYGILPDHLLQQVWAKTGDITHDKVTVSIPGGGYAGTDSLDKVMVGTGPFMFKEWVTGDHLTLVRNPHWWGGGGRPYLNEIRVKFDADPSAELNELRANTIDMGLDMRPSLLPTLSRMSDVTTVTILDSATEHLDINLHNTFLKDVTLRKAILMGIDRQKIVDTLLLGKTVVPPDAWMCIQTGAWCLDPNAKHSQYDPVAANKLLNDAGYKLQDSGTCKGFRTDPQGRCVLLRLVTTTLPLRLEQQVVITADLANIGIQIITPFTYNVPSSRMFGSCTGGGVIYSHNFDLAMYTTNYSYPAEPDSLAYTAYHSSQIPTDANQCVGQNTTFVSDPQLDQALDQARLSVRLSDRKDKYVVAQRRIADLVPEIPLYQAVDVEAYNKKLAGYKGNEFWWMNQTADWYINQ